MAIKWDKSKTKGAKERSPHPNLEVTLETLLQKSRGQEKCSDGNSQGFWVSPIWIEPSGRLLTFVLDSDR